MAWYYMDTAGAQKGPVDDAGLTAAYKAKTINDECYVWNGTTVNAWLQIKDPNVQKVVGKMFNPPKPKPKPKPAAPSQPAAPTRRANPMGGGGGGGRSALLMAIQKGKKLKKKKKAEPKCTRCGGKGVLPGGLPLPCPLCKKKKKKGGSKGGGGGLKKSVTKKKLSPKSSSSAAPKKSWSQRQAEQKQSNSMSGGGGGGGSSKVIIERIKRKLNGSFGANDMWKLKAIEKILS